MTSTRYSAAYRTIAKALRDDPDGAEMLCQFALYEMFWDDADRLYADVEKADKIEVLRKADDTRRALVRTFINKRLEGAPDAVCAEYLHQAATLTYLEGDALGVSKADDKATTYFDNRDLRGRFARAVNAFISGGETKTKAFERKWNEGDTGGTNRAVYSRMEATGNLLASSTKGNAKIAGQTLQVAGALGPEAEKVLGPGLRRTAYRYRGTEKTPDKVLARTMGTVPPGSLLVSVAAGNDAAHRKMQAAGGEVNSIMLARAGAQRGENSTAAQFSEMTAQQSVLAVRSDIGTNYALDLLPSLHEADASFASGRVPPSQGIIIDADGKVATEAMGFNGDHYLPFDLKNLKALNGGQYVRTRTIGGPTTEDIYTGLLTGARQVTVVSHSGVFTVEFDPALRGTKRYSDKSRAMVKRYERLLETIKDSPKTGLYQPGADVDTATQNRLRRDAHAYAEQIGDLDQAGEKFQELLREERIRQALPPDAGVMATETDRRAKQITPRGTTRQAAARAAQDAKYEAQDAAYEGKVKPYRLDGAGYALALRSLQQEFPYFIRNVDYETLESYTSSRGTGTPRKSTNAGDRGYIKPGNSLPSGPQYRDRYNGMSAGSTKTVAPASPGRAKGAVKVKAAEGTTPLTALASNNRFRENVKDSMTVLKNVVADTPQQNAYDTKAAYPSDKSKSIEGGLEYLADDADKLDWITRNYTSEQLASWLLDPKTDKGKISQFNRLVEQAVGRATHPDRSAQALGRHGADELKAAVATLSMSAVIGTPFAAKKGDGVVVRPDPDNPLPQPFDDIEPLGQKPENYAKFLSGAKIDDKMTAQAIEDHSGNVEGLRRKIDSAAKQLEDFQSWDGSQGSKPPGLSSTFKASDAGGDVTAHPAYKELRALQRAWSFLHGRTLAEAYSGGGAGPKATVPATVPVTVEVTKPDEEASKALKDGLVLVGQVPRGRFTM